MIALFSVPVLIGNIFQQLYNLVDTVIVGNTLGFHALGAVGSTGALSFLVLGFCNGLSGRVCGTCGALLRRKGL